MALGAQPGTVLGMVLREVLAMTGIGVLLGGAASYVTAKLAASMISGLLFGLKITDLSPIALAAVIMVGVAIIAGLGPARRASRGDPMVALREE